MPSEMAERFKYEFHVGIAMAEELQRPLEQDAQQANVRAGPDLAAP